MENLSTKSLVAEIEGLRKTRDHEQRLAIAASGRRHPAPDLSFEFSDPEAHDELYQIVKSSCKTLCASEAHFGRCMRFYEEFLERFYGIAPRDRRSESSIMDAPVRRTNTIYGNDNFYLLFKFHQVLHERISYAKGIALSVAQKWKHAEGEAPPDLYTRFLKGLHNMLSGSMHLLRYGPRCKCFKSIFGAPSSVLFSLDKLLFRLVKQVQATVADDMSMKLLYLYAYEKTQARSVRNDTTFYYANALVLLREKNIFRLERRFSPITLDIQLMEDADMRIKSCHIAPDRFSSQYLNDILLTEVSAGGSKPHVFLQRNKRKYVKDDANGDVAVLRAMENVLLVDGLKYRLRKCNDKVLQKNAMRYEKDTEEVFYRRKRPGRTGHHELQQVLPCNSETLSHSRKRCRPDDVLQRFQSLSFKERVHCRKRRRTLPA